MTPKRFEIIQGVVEKRQKYLTLVLENIHDPHNVSAILRCADAVGIYKVYLIYNKEKFPEVTNDSSGGANKWIDLIKFDNVKDCFEELKKENFKIYSTQISNSVATLSLYKLDLTDRVGLVFGNEHRGVSADVASQADSNFKVPMYGMVQSLNVSVAVGVCLYEALRQREIQGLYKKSNFTKKDIDRKLQDYLNK